MKEAVINLVTGMPPELAVFLLSALPVTEMRASLPLAITVFHLPPVTATVICLLGNLLPIPILLTLLPAAIRALHRWGPAWVQRLITRYFDYLKRKHADRFEKVGAAALGAVTLLPLPGAGVWTGCLLAVLFQIRPRFSVPALVAGAVAEAVVILLIVQGTLAGLSFLL